MASIRQIKRRIRSVQSIHEITKAMEMISAVRFKRIETRYKKALPYLRGLEELIGRVLSEETAAGNPYFERRDVKRELLVVVTGDRGLCGSFNTNLLRRAEGCLRENPGVEITFFPVGKVGLGFARRRGWRVLDALTDLGYRFTPETLAPTAARLVEGYLSGRFGRIRILSADFAKVGASRPVLETYLGLGHLLEEKKPDPGPELDYLFEPDRKTVLERLVDLFVKQRLFMTLLRSVTAEYNARMVAMKMATDNGEDVLKELKLERNKVRQAAITKEISEIIGGVNALN